MNERWNITSLEKECPEDIVKLSITLNGENNKISQLSLSTKVNIKMETVQHILQKHYTENLKSAKKSVRGLMCYSQVKSDVYHNPAIIDCEKEGEEKEDDEKEGIYYKAKILSLNLSSVLELAYNKLNKCTSAYSVEATSASFGVI